jgi:hypothetical protein
MTRREEQKQSETGIRLELAGSRRRRRRRRRELWHLEKTVEDEEEEEEEEGRGLHRWTKGFNV